MSNKDKDGLFKKWCEKFYDKSNNMDKDGLFKKWCEKFYDKYSDNVRLEDEDFQSLAIGFFIAEGCDLEQAYEMYNHCIKSGKF